MLRQLLRCTQCEQRNHTIRISARVCRTELQELPRFAKSILVDRASDQPRISPIALAGLFTAATAIALFSTAQSAAYFDYIGKDIPWIGLLKAQLTQWYLSALFVPLLYSLALRWPVTRRSWQTGLPLQALACLVCAMAKDTGFVAIGNWFRPGVFHLPEMLSVDFVDQVVFFSAVLAILNLWLVWLRSRTAVRNDAACIRHFIVSGSDGYRTVPCEQIEWIHAQGNYAQLHTSEGRHLVRQTMASLEHRLGNTFVRVHRGAIINRAHIERVEPRSHGSYAIIVSSGEEILSGRSYNRNLRSLFD